VTSTPSAASRQPQLVAKLMAAVRPEFRVDVLIPAVGAAIIGGPPCAVVGCGRARLHRGSGLCAAHQGRWRRDFPDLDLATYVATTPPRFRGDGRLVPCVVPVCRRPTTAHGLCIRHSHAWQRAGRPALADWVATVPAEADVPASCRLPSCGLWTTNSRKPLCRTHMQRWRDWQRRTGGQALEDFLSDCELRGVVHRFDFRPLPPRLKLELQYAVQHRVDDRRAMIEPRPAAYVLRFLAQCGATSLLDWPERAWEAAFQAWAPVGVGRRRNSNAHGFLRYAYRCVQDLAAGYGWEAEYPRDQWDLRRLGINGRTRWLRFHRIPQPWLRELVKRYARWKLTSGASDQAVQRCVQILSWFAEFLARPTVQVESLAALSRDALERYAAEVRALPYSARSRAGYVGAVQGFLLAIRQHRWDATLPGEALFYPEDYPRRPRLLPRALDEFVMAQIEHPDNLARLTDPTCGWRP
jgi:hypothetical protein